MIDMLTFSSTETIFEIIQPTAVPALSISQMQRWNTIEVFSQPRHASQPYIGGRLGLSLRFRCARLAMVYATYVRWSMPHSLRIFQPLSAAVPQPDYFTIFSVTAVLNQVQ